MKVQIAQRRRKSEESDECDTKSSGRISASGDALFWFGSPLLSSKDDVVFPAAARRRVPSGGRFHSCLRSTSLVSLDALGVRA